MCYFVPDVHDERAYPPRERPVDYMFVEEGLENIRVGEGVVAFKLIGVHGLNAEDIVSMINEPSGLVRGNDDLD